MKKRKMRRRVADLERRVAILEARANAIVPEAFIEDIIKNETRVSPYRSLVFGTLDR